MACSRDKLELNLEISLLEAEDRLVMADLALIKAKFATVRDTLADEIDELASNCTCVKVDLVSSAAEFAIDRLEKADEVAMLALVITAAIAEEAEPCLDLISLDAEMETCCSCWEKVAFSAMIVLEMATVAAFTEAMIKLEQS